MLNSNHFDLNSHRVLDLKQGLEANSELQLMKKYHTACCPHYQHAIVLILKERGYSTLEIGHLLMC